MFNPIDYSMPDSSVHGIRDTSIKRLSGIQHLKLRLEQRLRLKVFGKLAYQSKY